MPHELNSITISSVTLTGMRSSNDITWCRVLARFSPRVSVWLARGGVAKSDIPDLVQDVWRSVLISLRQFHREEPSDSFGGWLRTITRRRMADYFENRTTQNQAFQSIYETLQCTRVASNEAYESAAMSLRKRRLNHALEQVREQVEPGTWRAFELHVLEEKSVAEVVRTLDIPEHTVYTSKSRVLRRLRNIINFPATNLSDA